MAYNKNAKISINAVLSGSAALEAVRGTGTWGAGYVFGSGGLTNDIKVISDTFKNFSTSGSFATDAELGAISGYYQSGNISIRRADAAVSGIYIKSGTSATGVYKISLHSTAQVATGVGGGSGYLWIEAV